MGRDASLNEFLPDEGAPENPAGNATADESGGADGDPGERAGPAAEPAASTYDWTPGGAECAGCGATVERRWRDDGGLVCEACKAW